jgi:hypothetical protein
MNISNEDNTEFEFDEKLKARSFELVDASQALQFAEGLRLGSSLSSVNAREYARIERKYGKDHPRTKEMALRVEANEVAKKVLFTRYVAASTPQTDPGEGWAVDGFVRTADGEPVPGVTVAAYDRHERWYRELGYGCTNERGYFSMVAKKLSDKELVVYVRASKGKKLLPSNEVRLAPAPKSTDRVEIIIGDTGGKGDCIPPVGNKRKPMPPSEPVRGKDQSASPFKEKPAPADPAKEVRKKTTGGKTVEVKVEKESQKKAQEKERQELKKKGSKPDAGGGSKRSGPKNRRR